MQHDKLEFRDAVQYLANQLGLELPIDDSDDKSALYKQLFTIMQDANRYYQQQLRQSSQAKQYLISRGLNGEIAKAFNIGYVADGWNNLCQQFPSNEDQQLLSQAGMTKQKSGRHYDTFRHRIMFPIRNTRGQVAGFGGRSIDDSTPKYLNSPETPIFHKNEELFGLYEAKSCNPKGCHLVVVEGYMDVIALHQFGITQAVATLGTAINRHHIQKLLRYSNHIIFCFDGDGAGQKAAWKALKTCLPFMREGTCFQFFSIAQGDDPDSLVRKLGPDTFNKQLTNSPEISTTLFAELHQRHACQTLSGKAGFAKDAMELINTMPDGIFKEILIEQLAKEIQVDKVKIQTLIQDQPTEISSHPADQEAPSEPPPINTRPALSFKLPLSPTMMVSAIITQHPEMAHQIPNDTPFNENCIETKWLQNQIRIIKKEGIQNTSAIFNHIKEQNHPLLGQLAQHDLTVPTSGLEKELLGALSRMQEQLQQSQLQSLIQKSKTTPLSTHEKDQLKLILNSKNKKLLDQEIP